MNRVLVITSVIPTDLAAGDRLYTYHLFHALARYIHVTVIGHEDYRGGSCREGWVSELIPVHCPRRAKTGSVLSRFPAAVYQEQTKTMRSEIMGLASNYSYDAILCDHFRMFWTAEVFNEQRRRLGKAVIPTVLIAHNYETSHRRQLAEHDHKLLRRIAFRLDYMKTKLQENIAFRIFDAITAITPEDAVRIAKIAKGKVTILTPGYEESIPCTLEVTARTPKQVVVVGSFFWEAKQLNLRRLIEAAADSFSRRGIRLKVVGPGPGELFTELARYDFVEFTGYVESVKEHLRDSRIGLIAESIGGGFKLKALDYVFNHIPILALEGTLAGLNLQNGKDCLSYATMNDLVDGVTKEIDHIDKLRMLAANAYAGSINKYRWDDRARVFNELISELIAQRI